MGLYRRLFKTKGGRRVLLGAAALLLLNEVAFYFVPTAQFKPICNGSYREAEGGYVEMEGPFTQRFLSNLEEVLIEMDWLYVRLGDSFFITRDQFYYRDYVGGYVGEINNPKMRNWLSRVAVERTLQPILPEEKALAVVVEKGSLGGSTCDTMRRTVLPDGDLAQRIKSDSAEQEQ